MNKKLLISLFFLILFVSNSYAISISASIPEKYTDVSPGERLYFEIDIKYPENPQRKDLIFEYEIVNQEDNVIAFSKTLKAIETQASFVESIIIPENIESGLHILNIKVSGYNDELNEEVSTSFVVKKQGLDTLQIYLFAILGVVCILTILVVISLIKLNSIRRRGNESII